MEVLKWGGNSIAFQLAVIKPKKEKKEKMWKKKQWRRKDRDLLFTIIDTVIVTFMLNIDVVYLLLKENAMTNHCGLEV